MAGRPSARSIIVAVARHYDVTTKKLTGRTDRKSVAPARWIAMSLIYNFTDSSTTAIGKMFGHKDHTSVVYGLKKAGQLIVTDKEFKSAFQAISGQLNMKGS